MRAHDGRGVAREGWLAGEHLVSNHAEAVNVRARVDVTATTLFGRHVKRRAHNRADASQCRSLISSCAMRVVSTGRVCALLEE